jgi:hypothetical protein
MNYHFAPKKSILQKIKQASEALGSLPFIQEELPINSVDCNFATTDKPLKFSDQVPIFLSESVKSPGNFLKFNTVTNGVNNVCVSFAKEDCTEAQFNTLGNNHLDGIIYRIATNLKSLPQLKEDKIKLVKQLSSENKYYGMEHGFSSLSTDDQMIVKYLLKNIECYAGIKFHLSDLHKKLCEYHISICNSKDVYSSLGGTAYAVQAVDSELGINVSESLIMIDKSKYNIASDFNEVGIDYFINTIGHELLHTLGLAHPIYKNLAEQLKYRSLVADDDSKESFLSKKCFKQIKNSKNPKKDYAECLNPPVDLQPVDVKGLITIWRESQDYSDYCLALREEFISIHQSVMLPEEN